jgi:hypothetical protein
MRPDTWQGPLGFLKRRGLIFRDLAPGSLSSSVFGNRLT